MYVVVCCCVCGGCPCGRCDNKDIQSVINDNNDAQQGGCVDSTRCGAFDHFEPRPFCAWVQHANHSATEPPPRRYHVENCHGPHAVTVRSGQVRATIRSLFVTPRRSRRSGCVALRCVACTQATRRGRSHITQSLQLGWAKNAGPQTHDHNSVTPKNAGYRNSEWIRFIGKPVIVWTFS